MLISRELIIELLKGKPYIACFETAADFLGISNGGCYTKIHVFSLEPVSSDIIESTVVDSFDDIECLEKDEILCTTEEQTIVDLLTYDRDDQAICESINFYYYTHGKSLDAIRDKLPEELVKRFEEYAEDALEFFNC